jgi:hypothetical protein
MPGVGTTHHIRLGGRYYLVRPGSYVKRVAPQFGARFTTGDPDYNNLSFWQHWAQRCWVGGMGAEDWADDAMFDAAVGIDSTEHERLTVGRGLIRGSGANWALSSGTAHARSYRACVYNDRLYVLGVADAGVASHLYVFDPATDGWTRVTSLDAVAIRGISIGTFAGRLYIGGLSTAGQPRLVYGTGDLSSGWTVVPNPAGVGSRGIAAVRSFQQRLYVAYGTQVWRLKEDNSWDGNTVFYTADQNSESNEIVAFEVHLGFLYMLSKNGHIHRTDGNLTFDLWSWGGQTFGIDMESFDGRLFIVTYEYTNNPDVGYSVLYQMSGSAVTELKRWGRDGVATRVGSLRAYDRRLLYGASALLAVTDRLGFGIAAYDPVEDGHSIIASNADTVSYPPGSAPYRNLLVQDVIGFEGRLFAFVRGFGGFYTPYKPADRRIAERIYDVSASGSSLAARNGGFIESSTYDAGTPGLRKLWRRVVLDYSIPSADCGLVVEYSTDGGRTYVVLGTVTAVGERRRAAFALNNVISVSFRLRITLRTTNQTVAPTLHGWVVSYVPVVEPDWMWTFTIVLSQEQELLDGTVAIVDTEAELAFLSAAYRGKQMLHFVDAEGVEWAAGGQPGVIIYDMAVQLHDLGQPLEGEVTVTLLEAVESY